MRFFSFSAVVAILFSCSVTAQTIDQSKWYHINVRVSDLYCGVVHNNLYEGCAFGQLNEATEDGQAFRFTNIEDDLYKMEVKNKDMVVGIHREEWGEYIVLEKWSNKSSQLWKITQVDGEWFSISSAESGKIWVIDRDRKDAGAWVLVWDQDPNRVSSQFKLVPFAGENPLPWENLGRSINTEISEVAPMVSHDGRVLYYSHGHSKNGRIGDGNIFRAEIKEDGSWGRGKLVTGSLNTDSHNVVFSVQPGDNKLFLMGGYGNSEAMFSECERTATGWSDPKPIIIPNHGKTTHNYSGRMGADGRTIIIQMNTKMSVSDDDGNLFVTFKKDNGSWTKPKALGPVINTKYAEATPFLAADMKTLYFASDRPGSLGGTDTWMSRRLDDTWTNWSEPINLGPTVNTESWELYYVVPANGEYAYFTSNHQSWGASDIHRVRLKEEVRPEPVLLIKGRTLNKKDNSPVGATIRYEALDGSGTLGELRSNPSTGEYQITLPKGRNYGFFAQADGFASVTANIDLTDLDAFNEQSTDLYLVPIAKGEVIRLNNIFFDFGKASLRAESYPELDRLVQLLKDNKQLKIEIGGHTDNVGDDASNKALSGDRAKAVVDYLVSKGIKELRLTSQGYGESKPVANNETDEGRQANRRVEFTILE